MLDDSTVFVVDDDQAVRNMFSFAIRSIGLHVVSLASAEEFLESYTGQTGCLVLNVRLPGMSGPELQECLAAKGCDLPVIMVTGHGDISLAVTAMHLGAIDFLEKPVKEKTLLDKHKQGQVRLRLSVFQWFRTLTQIAKLFKV